MSELRIERLRVGSWKLKVQEPFQRSTRDVQFNVQRNSPRQAQSVGSASTIPWVAFGGDELQHENANYIHLAPVHEPLSINPVAAGRPCRPAGHRRF